MRVLLVCTIFALLAGCAAVRSDAGAIAVGVRGPDTPPVVIRTLSEFEDFLNRARAAPGADDPNGLAHQLEGARPDFDRRVLVLVRHDANSGSRFGFSTEGPRSGVPTCDVRTRRSGSTRDTVPYWFAVAVDAPGPDRVEVRVDGQRQENAR